MSLRTILIVIAALALGFWILFPKPRPAIELSLPSPAVESKPEPVKSRPVKTKATNQKQSNVPETKKEIVATEEVSGGAATEPAVAPKEPEERQVLEPVEEFANLMPMLRANRIVSLNDFSELDEQRPAAGEKKWNGNYLGKFAIGGETVPVVVNLHFNRVDDSEPITCIGIFAGDTPAIYAKGDGAFVPRWDRERDYHLVFNVGEDRVLQALFSGDNSGFAATLYRRDADGRLVFISSGEFKLRAVQSEEAFHCRAI